MLNSELLALVLPWKDMVKVVSYKCLCILKDCVIKLKKMVDCKIIFSQVVNKTDYCKKILSVFNASKCSV